VLPVYALVVAKHGLHMDPINDGASPPAAPAGNTTPKPLKIPDAQAGEAQFFTVGVAMPEFAQYLSGPSGRTVLDRTGLTGKYAFTLHWMPSKTGPPASQPPGESMQTATGALAPVNPLGPSIFTAVEEQLGLKLEPDKAPVDMIIVDQIEQPSSD
jgi:uncharacterized protein (TIGR03435 family)